MKIARKRFASILLVIGLTGISPAWSQTPERHHTFRKAKVVWRSCESNTVKLGDLARWASPILWFSPDEPLLEHRKSDDPLIKKEYLTQSEKVVPNVMPYDEVPGGPEQRAVYAWIRKLRPRPEAKRGDLLKKYAKSPLQRRLWEETVNVNEVEGIYIRYLFYYNEDIGISPHKHDLESLQIELAVQQPAARKRQPGNPSETPKDCPDQKQGIEIVLVRASGSAHGIAWFTSTLDTETADDILLPLTVLVEEGKHASAPDRNGDGVYTPCYDVNVQVHDAWGVRDTMRSNWIDNPSYRPEMNKSRNPGDRVFPNLPRNVFTEYSERRHEPEVASSSGPIDKNVYELRVPPYNDKLCLDEVPNPSLKTDPDPKVRDTDHKGKHEL